MTKKGEESQTKVRQKRTSLEQSWAIPFMGIRPTIETSLVDKSCPLVVKTYPTEQGDRYHSRRKQTLLRLPTICSSQHLRWLLFRRPSNRLSRGEDLLGGFWLGISFLFSAFWCLLASGGGLRLWECEQGISG